MCGLMGNCCPSRAPQSQYFWHYGSRGFFWYHGGILWSFEVDVTCGGQELNHVWISEHGHIFEDGPDPWREWIRSNRAAQECVRLGRRVALARLTERIPTAVVAHVARFCT